MSQGYVVLFNGELSEEFTREEVKANLVDKLNLREGRAEQILSHTKVVLKHGLEIDKAISYSDKLAKLGMLTVIAERVDGVLVDVSPAFIESTRESLGTDEPCATSAELIDEEERTVPMNMDALRARLKAEKTALDSPAEPIVEEPKEWDRYRKPADVSPAADNAVETAIKVEQEEPINLPDPEDLTPVVLDSAHSEPTSESVTIRLPPLAEMDPSATAQAKQATQENDNIRVAEEPDAPLRAEKFSFHGSGKEYFGIWIVNTLLTIVTLGFYSPWAKVRNTQYFYSNTRLDKSNFQYLANPWAIFKGRLIAVAFFIVYFVVQYVSEIGSLIMAGVILLALPWIVARSLRFNLVNSAFRNVRFNFEINYGQAYLVFLVYGLLMILSFGLLLPFILQRTHRFIVDGSRFGQSAFKFEGTVKSYYMLYLHLLLVGIVGGLIGVGIGYYEPMLALIAAVPFYYYLGAYFVAHVNNLYFNNTTLEGHRFYSNMEAMKVLKLYAINSLLILLTFGLYIPWAQVKMASYRASCTEAFVDGDLDNFIASEEKQSNALGEELGDVFDMEVAAF